MSKLTERLRTASGWDHLTLVNEAADRIEHLEREVQEFQQLAARGADGLMKASQTIAYLERVLVQAREALNLAASFQEGGTLRARSAIAAIDEALKDR